jgi:hypothetical protein
MSQDGHLIEKQKVTHILNTMKRELPNIFDASQQMDKHVQAILKETKQQNSKLIGTTKYFSISNWTEHKIVGIENLDFAEQLFEFIEEAV